MGALADELMALPASEKLRAAAELFDAGGTARQLVAEQLVRIALEEQELARVRERAACEVQVVVDQQMAMQVGESVA